MCHRRHRSNISPLSLISLHVSVFVCRPCLCSAVHHPSPIPLFSLAQIACFFFVSACSIFSRLCLHISFRFFSISFRSQSSAHFLYVLLTPIPSHRHHSLLAVLCDFFDFSLLVHASLFSHSLHLSVNAFSCSIPTTSTPPAFLLRFPSYASSQRCRAIHHHIPTPCSPLASAVPSHLANSFLFRFSSCLSLSFGAFHYWLFFVSCG